MLGEWELRSQVGRERRDSVEGGMLEQEDKIEGHLRDSMET